MPRILWSQPARCDLLEIRSWTEQHTPNTAEKEAQRILAEIEKLASFPRMGRRIRSLDDGPEEIRELVIAPYLVRYVLDENRVISIRLWHSRRGADRR